MPIDQDFVASIRGDPPPRISDDELRSSLRNGGWDPHMPAVRDEHGVVLKGNRRIRFAADLGIEPVILTVAFGSGPEADAARLSLAWRSNLGGVGVTPADRKRAAERLYRGGMTQTAIAENLGVSQATISYDLGELSTVDNSTPRPRTPTNPRGAGRPRGSGPRAPRGRPTAATRAAAAPPPTPAPPEPSQAAPRHPMPEATPSSRPDGPCIDTRTPAVMALREQGLTMAQIGQRSDMTERTARRIIEAEVTREAGRAAGLIEATIDPSTLSRSAQERLEAAIRQHRRTLDQEYAERLRLEVVERLRVTLARLHEKERTYNLVLARRRGIMPKADYDIILTCIHPDSRQSASDEKLAKAFRIWTGIKPLVLDETQAPVAAANAVPRTVEELMAMRQQVQEQRRAARAARQPR